MCDIAQGDIVDRENGVEQGIDLVDSQPFADNGNVNSSNFPYVGDSYIGGDGAGPFNARFNYGATYADSYVGARQSCTSRSNLHRKDLGKSMEPQLLLKKDGRTRIAGIVPPYGFGTPGRAKEGDIGTTKQETSA